ncbi:hypothetical protein GH714_008941 [Hevea brasiliensis]|uniref:Uncharacterized protein n=1 Tax=Hevea brasiliensis TaxID=3981 RepID=A0A6A6LJ91_HEVBR|nr:hypothetical protein GH714_008941 [Hevea brasiliensis]
MAKQILVGESKRLTTRRGKRSIKKHTVMVDSKNVDEKSDSKPIDVSYSTVIECEEDFEIGRKSAENELVEYTTRDFVEVQDVAKISEDDFERNF